MADETIIIQYIVEAAKALEEAQKMREIINQTKTDVAALAQTGRASFKDLGRAMIKEFQMLKNDSAGKKALGDFLKIDPDSIQSATAFAQARQRAIQMVRTAVQELGQEERAQAAASAKAVTSAKSQEAAAQREYERITKQGYGVMSQAAQAYGAQVAAAKQQIMAQSQSSGQTYQQVAQQMQQAGTNANVLNSALKQLNTTATKTNSMFGNLGSLFKQVFVIGLGVNFANMLRMLSVFMQDAAKAGYELAKAFFQLEVGIRALRRAGTDIVTSDMLNNLDRLREKFGVFSRVELVKGSAELANLIRSFGMTKEQIFELQDAIATLAVVNGRAMDDVQKTVALALASGYTEGLQRLGVSINRVNIAVRAGEMGFGRNYLALTENQRAMATFSLIMEKTALYADDLTQYLRTESGMIDTITTRIEDQTAILGQELLPAQLEYNRALLRMIELLTDVIGLFTPLISLWSELNTTAQHGVTVLNEWDATLSKNFGVYRQISGVIKTLHEGVKTVLNPLQMIGKATDYWRQSFLKLKEAGVGPWAESMTEKWGWLADMVERTFDIVDTFDGQQPDVATPEVDTDKMEENGDAVKDHVQELYSDIQRETVDFNNDMEALARDLIRDLAEIERDLGRDLAKIDRDLAADLARDRRDLDADLAEMIMDRDSDIAKISEDGNRKILEENEDFAKEQADIQRKYANDVAEANQKQRDAEIEAEIEYQSKLRKLREEFLFDLEDALRERDARQVLNLTRRYNLDQSQMATDFANEQAERARQHQARLEELRRERDERMRALAEEHAEKLAQIREDTQREIEERQRQYERDREERLREAERKRQERELAAEAEREERRIKAEEEKEERKIQQEERIAELKIEFQERLEELVDALATEKDMTAAMLQQIGDEYRKMYGPNGVIDQQIAYHIARLGQLAAMRALATGASSFSMNENVAGTLFKKPGNTGGGGLPGKVFADGGIYYADRPTTVTFGEKGLEQATFTPLSYTGRNEGKVVGGGELLPQNRDGTIALRVLMSPELIGEIQENTLDRAANILFEVQRRR